MKNIDIITAFKKPGEKLQLQLIDKIAKLGDAGKNLLINIYENTDSIAVKRWAVHGIGKFNDDESRNIISNALLHDAMSIRLHAIHAIYLIGDKIFAEKLKLLINDTSSGIRSHVLEVAYALKIKGYKNIIQKYQNDVNYQLKFRANQLFDIINRK